MCVLNVNLLFRIILRILSVFFVWILELLRWKLYWYEDGLIVIVCVLVVLICKKFIENYFDRMFRLELIIYCNIVGEILEV